jgi:hypothetical protein
MLQMNFAIGKWPPIANGFQGLDLPIMKLLPAPAEGPVALGVLLNTKNLGSHWPRGTRGDGPAETRMTREKPRLCDLCTLL